MINHIRPHSPSLFTLTPSTGTHPLDRTCFVSLFFIFLCHTSFWNPSMWLHISVFITFYRKVMWTPWKSSCSSTIYLKQSSLLLKIELLWYLSWKLGWVYNRKSILGFIFFPLVYLLILVIGWLLFSCKTMFWSP
jgi:hypothetical protein